MSRLLKVVAAAAGTLAITAITAAAVNHIDKTESQRNDNNNSNNEPVPTIHWPTSDESDSLNELQIYLDDNGIVDIDRLKSDRLYARSCGIRGFNLIERGECWLAILDHDNFITYSTIHTNNNQSSIYQQLVLCEPSDQSLQHIQVIQRDVHRTRMIHASSFGTVEQADTALLNVLSAYAKHDPHTGYCQGMNMIVAYMLTQVSEEHAYWILYQLMTNKYYNLRTVYAIDLNGILLFKYQFQQLFQHYLPELYHHFIQHDITLDICIEWWMTLFTLQAMPRNVLGRIWDLYLVDGFKALHRITLSILSQSSDTLLSSDMEGIYQYIKTLPDHGVLHDDSLIATALSFNVNEELLSELTALYMYQNKHNNNTNNTHIQQHPIAQPVLSSTSMSSAVRQRRNNNA